MYEASEMLYLYVETPLHAGSGTTVGVVDLPIQRERVTNYPMVQASGLKGKLRAEADQKRKASGQVSIDQINLVFGHDGHDFAGALSPGDAKLLLFPVRSLAGVFAWTTSRNVLARFRRDLAASNQAVAWNPANFPDDENAYVATTPGIVVNNKVVLEEFTFDAKSDNEVNAIAKWIAETVFPQSPEYEYFCKKVADSLVILPEDAFRDFTQFATEVITRIKIDQETKTVADRALWTEEHLPSDSVLYSPLHATGPRQNINGMFFDGAKPDANRVLAFVKGLGLSRIQLGGDETVGRGMVRLHFGGDPS